MNYGLKDTVIERLQSIFRAYPQVSKVIIYGSRARGDYKKGSDIDLTLQGEASLDWKILGRIQNEIDDLLLPYKLDISLYHEISDKDVLLHIKNFGKEFYSK